MLKITTVASTYKLPRHGVWRRS